MWSLLLVVDFKYIVDILRIIYIIDFKYIVVDFFFPEKERKRKI